MHWYRIIKLGTLIDWTDKGEYYSEFIHGPDLSKLEDFAVWWWDGRLNVSWKHDHPDIPMMDFSHMTVPVSDPGVYTWSGRFNPKTLQLSIVPMGNQFRKIPSVLIRRLYQTFGENIKIHHFAAKNKTIKTASNIAISIEKYKQSIFQYLEYLAYRSIERYEALVAKGNLTEEELVQKKNNIYTEEDAKEDATRLVKETFMNMQKLQQLIQQTISRIPNWNNSPIRIVVEKYDPSLSYEINSEDSATIEVGNQSAWGGVASFSYFGGEKPEIDDVLEAGDDDFFTENATQSDYFNLIRELRSPGSSQQGKNLLLYTARPSKDRQLFENATTVPGNLFLTNNADRAFGIGVDFGGRDVWAIKINEKYLTETLSAGYVKDYQITGGSNVPVVQTRLISAGESK